jgi:hypothetical protein
MKNKSLSMFGVVTISISLILSFSDVTSQINHPPQAMADVSNNTTSAAMSVTPVLGNPIFSVHDRATSQKQVVINGTNGLITGFSGHGTIKGIDFTDVGTALSIFRSNGYRDIKGQEVITTTAGKDGDGSNGTRTQENATGTFYTIGYRDANGIVRDNGTIFFHTNSTTGRLASIDNLAVVFRDQVDKGNGIAIGWEWK